jgi:very-short-patch-repair endonuclease
MAAVLSAGPDAALSHLAAATLSEIWRRGSPARIDVVTPRRRPGKRRNVTVHWCRHLDNRDVTARHGIPVTTVARTLVDLTDVLDAGQLANVIHEAAFRGRFNAKATLAAMARVGGRHHLDVLAAALDAHAAGSAGTRSAPEDAFLALVRSRSLPEPLVNVPVRAGSRHIEVDFQWRNLGLCVEVDGPGHRRPRTHMDDVERDDLLRATGREVLRFTDEDVALRPAKTLDALEAALARAAA